MSNSPLYGKYRGTVVNNIDPEQIGRIQVVVPDVTGLVPGSWAMPCLPISGINMGMFTVPNVGTKVWIEFERGECDFPIWSGGFWGTASEVPALSRAVPAGIPGITLQTLAKNGIVISDTPGPSGGIQIQTASGAMIVVNDLGITIANGKGAVISLSGPTVDVNSGALTVT